MKIGSFISMVVMGFACGTISVSAVNDPDAAFVRLQVNLLVNSAHQAALMHNSAEEQKLAVDLIVSRIGERIGEAFEGNELEETRYEISLCQKIVEGFEKKLTSGELEGYEGEAEHLAQECRVRLEKVEEELREGEVAHNPEDMLR